jgi:GTP-binding protein
MAKPVIAVVGRPNVGKSTLFNKLVGQRLSIVEDTPGVTRDRIYAAGEWLGREFMLVDTGGIEPKSSDVILAQMRRQAQLAIESADVIILVTDLKTGVTATDHDVANMLLKSRKPVVLCVNKCDRLGEPPVEFYEFYNLGLGDPIAVSSVHGHGTGDLLDACFAHIDFEDREEEDDDHIKVAIIGKPNVGKSSLVNRMAGEERVIVSNIAGTTRDATDTVVENEHGRFIFIDTAGIRRKTKVEDAIEKYSVLRSYMAVDRADVCVIVIDATEGFTEQDSKVAGYAHEQGKGCIIAVNKWDAVEKDGRTMQEFTRKLQEDFSFMSYAPFLFISALTGQRVDKLYDLIEYVGNQNAMRISTGRLNDMLAYATARVQPPSDKGKRLKIFYMTQAATKPPTFVAFVNSRELFHFSYQRYLENQIRETFSLDGTPIRLLVRERGDK